MPSLLWIALLVLLVASTAGAVYVFLRARVLWRSLKSFGPVVDVTVDRLNESLDRLSATTETYESGQTKLEASLERLRRSRARLAVLRAAIQDVQDTFGRVAAVYPRK